jgi:hypothetical protein
VVALLWNLARTGMNSNALPWAAKADGDNGHPTGAVIETEAYRRQY